MVMGQIFGPSMNHFGWINGYWMNIECIAFESFVLCVERTIVGQSSRYQWLNYTRVLFRHAVDFNHIAMNEFWFLFLFCCITSNH